MVKIIDVFNAQGTLDKLGQAGVGREALRIHTQLLAIEQAMEPWERLRKETSESGRDPKDIEAELREAAMEPIDYQVTYTVTEEILDKMEASAADVAALEGLGLLHEQGAPES